MSLHTYYGGLQMLTHDRKFTNLHATIWFRNDCTTDLYEEVVKEFTNICQMLKGCSAKITEYTFLGPIEVCLLEIENDNNNIHEYLSSFSNKYSFRKNLDVQFSFCLHTSKGDSKSTRLDKVKEYQENCEVIEQNGGIGSILIFDDGYIKDMDSKEIVYTTKKIE